MSFIACQFLGRLGNTMFTYAFCRAYAEKHGLELQTDLWAGQKIFQINGHPISNPNAKRRDENNLIDGEKDFVFRSYCQNQKSAIYTKEQVKRWFTFRPDILEKLNQFVTKDEVLGHRRMGDYAGSGFPVISQSSYYKACIKFGIAPDDLTMITEENPLIHHDFKDELAAIPDFYRLMSAKILFRGNSTFSWWAAMLGNARVFAPVVKGIGLVGGKEVDVEFVEGNHPATADFDFVSDIHLT